MRFTTLLATAIMFLATTTAATAAQWTETPAVKCGDRTHTITVVCTTDYEVLRVESKCVIDGKDFKSIVDHVCSKDPNWVEPAPEPELEMEMEVAPEETEYEDGFFLGARFLHVAIPGSASFNGGEAMAGFRHYFPDSGWFLQVDGGAGGGNHAFLVDDDEPDSSAALGTLAARLGVRPLEWLSLSIGIEGLVTGNGTETLMAGGTGVFQVGIQYDIVRVSAWIGAGLSHHSDPETRMTWNGQVVTDINSLPAHALPNVLTEKGFDYGLDPVVTGGISLVFELP